MTITILSLALGMLLMGAVLTFAVALSRPQPDLQSAIANLSNQVPTLPVELDQPPANATARVGQWILLHLPLRPSARQRAQLQLRGMNLAEFYGNRLVWAFVLGAAPWLFELVQVVVGQGLAMGVPGLLTVLLAVAGWFLPVLQLRQAQEATEDDTLESFLALMDLVVLERLANRQAVDAITNAATVSNNPLFVQVQRTLTRASLENMAPWEGLLALADQINLPELRDLVAIARLQDQGAGLVESLRARTEELRNAYLLRMRKESTRITQRMTFPKLIPPMSIVLLLIGASLLNVLLQGS